MRAVPMAFRLLAVVAALVLAVAALATAWDGRANRAPGPEGAGSPLPSAAARPGGGVAAPASGSPYTFDDEFDGQSLDPVWQRHFDCCGPLAGHDPGLTTVSDGLLTMAVERRSDGWWGDLIDTKSTFTQLYGTFEARIRIPSGAGLWPAFWGYASGSGGQAEIDTLEACGGEEAPGGGSILHNTVWWSGRQSLSHTTPTTDLTAGFHVYGVDWRSDHLAFLLDGQTVWSFPEPDRIPSVPLPLILDLGVGGAFCGPPDASTPTRAEMQVDWVRVLP